MASPMSMGQNMTGGGLAGSNITSPGSGTGFLPGFLMGEYSQQGTGRMVSPTKLNRSISQNVTGTPQTPVGTPTMQNRVNGFLTPSTPSAHTSTPGGSLRNPSSDKQATGGPPTSGLYSTPKQRRALHAAASTSIGSATPIGGSLFGTPVTGIHNLSVNTPPHQLNASINELGSSTCHEGSTWVTVFGFPSSAASYILQQFSQCGTVLQHHIPANGNWMNIRYQTKMQAQSALGRHGRIMGGTLMIGVMPSQGDAHTNAGQNSSQILDQRASHSRAGRSDSSCITNISSNLGSTPSKSIRPLTQAYKAAQSEHEVSMSSNTPSKNDGIVSRAMEYIFGW